MKLHFKYNPSMVRLGNALVKVSMTTAFMSLVQQHTWITAVLMGIGCFGEILKELFKNTDNGTETNP